MNKEFLSYVNFVDRKMPETSAILWRKKRDLASKKTDKKVFLQSSDKIFGSLEATSP